jgi:hypothetical protein
MAKVENKKGLIQPRALPDSGHSLGRVTWTKGDSVTWTPLMLVPTRF